MSSSWWCPPSLQLQRRGVRAALLRDDLQRDGRSGLALDDPLVALEAAGARQRLEEIRLVVAGDDVGRFDAQLYHGRLHRARHDAVRERCRKVTRVHHLRLDAE